MSARPAPGLPQKAASEEREEVDEHRALVSDDHIIHSFVFARLRAWLEISAGPRGMLGDLVQDCHSGKGKAVSLVTNTGDGAIISACECYRYRLTRAFAPAKSPYVEKDNLIAWLMFNPSEADASKNDPTIRKIIGFSRRWGFTFADVYNKFAGRTPHPEKLWKMDDPVGPDNYEYLKLIPYNVTLVAAWGGIAVPKKFADWSETVEKMLMCRNTHHLGFTKDGQPRHPLMLPYSTPLTVWRTP